MQLGNKVVSGETRLHSRKVFGKFWAELYAAFKNHPLATPEVMQQFKLALLKRNGQPHPLLISMIENGLITTQGISRRGMILLWQKEATGSDLYEIGIFREFTKHHNLHNGTNNPPEKTFAGLRFRIAAQFNKTSFLMPLLKNSNPAVERWILDQRVMLKETYRWRLWRLRVMVGADSPPDTSQSQLQPTR